MLKSGLITVIFLIVLYLGSGGFIILQNEQLYEKAFTLEKKEVVYENINFYNKEVMRAAREQELIISIYPYATKIPSFLSFLLTAISFGIIGSLGKVINDSIQNGTNFKDALNLMLIPIQGGIIGIIILGISYTIPILLTNENVTLKPITIVFLSLFGGIFYLNFYNWITNIIGKVLFSNKDKNSSQ